MSQELDLNESGDLGVSYSLNEINGNKFHEDQVLDDQDSTKNRNQSRQARYGGKNNSRKMERRISFEVGINS